MENKASNNNKISVSLDSNLNELNMADDEMEKSFDASNDNIELSIEKGRLELEENFLGKVDSIAERIISDTIDQVKNNALTKDIARDIPYNIASNTLHDNENLNLSSHTKHDLSLDDQMINHESSSTLDDDYDEEKEEEGDLIDDEQSDVEELTTNSNRKNRKRNQRNKQKSKQQQQTTGTNPIRRKSDAEQQEIKDPQQISSTLAKSNSIPGKQEVQADDNLNQTSDQKIELQESSNSCKEDCSFSIPSSTTINKSDKMNGVKSYGSNHMNGGNESTICKICSKHVYHMEQIKAVKSIFHKSCFRCVECNKQLNVDSYSSHEGLIYCKLHFKQLFQPKPIFDTGNGQIATYQSLNGVAGFNGENGKECEKPKKVDDTSSEIDSEQKQEETSSSTTKTDEEKSRKKYELIICENEPIELPPDVVRYDSRQPDIFENLSLDLSNIRNRFENGCNNENSDSTRRSFSSDKPITRSESIHKIMQKYQSRVAGDSFVNSSSDEEDNVANNTANSNNNNNESSLINHSEKVSFTGMSTLKSQWETGSINASQSSNRSNADNELAELRKKGKSSEPLKQVYERAIQEAKSTENLSSHKSSDAVLVDSSIKAVSIKEKFEKGEMESEEDRIERLRKEREAEITQISNNDAALKEARQKFKQIEQNMGREQLSNADSTSNGHLEDVVSIDSEQLQQRFNYFENLNGNSAKDGDDVTDHCAKVVDDIPKVDTTKKMLSKFKALEAGQVNGNGDMTTNGTSGGPKMPKRITPPRETTKVFENEPLVERDPNIVKSSYKTEDMIQVEPEKAKNLRAKFENWQTEIERENRKNNQDDYENDFVPLERDTTKNLRAMFESIQTTNESKPIEKPRPRVNRFVDKTYQQNELCYVCSSRIYPMEKKEFSGIKLHKNCFRCTKCHMPLRLDNFTQHAEKFFCIPHFKQLFMEKGNYDEGFGLEQHKDKWANKSASTTSMNGGCKSSAAATKTSSQSLNNNKQTNGGTNGIHHDNDYDEEIANNHHHDGLVVDDSDDGPLDSIDDNYPQYNGTAAAAGNGQQTLELEDY